MGGRLDAVEVELGDLADRLEDGRELALEARHLLLREAELRERRDVQHLLSRDRHSTHPLKAEGPFRGPPRHLDESVSF